MEKKQFNDIVQWQDRTFPNSTPYSKIIHLKEEIEELLVEIENDNLESAKKEISDCFILLFGVAHKLGLSFDDIQSSIDNKHNENLSRKWGKPDDSGVVRHIK